MVPIFTADNRQGSSDYTISEVVSTGITSSNSKVSGEATSTGVAMSASFESETSATVGVPFFGESTVTTKTTMETKTNIGKEFGTEFERAREDSK